MKKFKLLALTSVVVAMMGCSAENQDNASNNIKPQVPVSGVVIDPNIMASVVFADYDDDGVLDTFEPWTLTDRDGYFGTSKMGEDYCETNKSYCLILANNDPVSLVAVGGYDLATLERINTRLSRIYSGEGVQVITPLTSLTSMIVTDEISKDLNFMALAFSDESSTLALQLAFNLHKVVEVLSAVLEREYTAIGDNELLPCDVSGFVYQAINKVGSDQQLTLDDFLQKHSENQIELLLTDSRKSLNAAYKQAGVSLFENAGYVKQPRLNVAKQSALSSQTQALSDVIERLNTFVITRFEAISGNELIAEQPKLQLGMLRQIQLAVNSVIDAMATNRDLLTSVVAYLDIIDASDEELITYFGQESYDSSIFANQVIAVEGDVNQVLGTMTQRLPMPAIMGAKKLSLRDINNKEEAKITFYFEGELAGSLQACIYYQDLLDPTDINNTQGTLVEGEWIKDGYQLFVKLTIAGSPRSLRIKSGVGSSFIFDYDNKDKKWDGAKAFEDIVNPIPSTDVACQNSFI